MRKFCASLGIVVSAMIPVTAAHAALEFVGSWSVYDERAPVWSHNTPGWRAYTGQEAAAFLFGGTPNQYVISTAGDSADSVNYKAWYDVIGVGAAEFDYNYNNKYLNQLYGPTSGYNCCGNQFVNVNAASALIRDNFVYQVNFAFRDTSVTPLNDGSSDLSPLLPVTTDVNSRNVFEFVPVPNRPVWIDPFVATGYDYTSDAPILTVQFTNLGDPDGYDIFVGGGGTAILSGYKPGIDAPIVFADHTAAEVLAFSVRGIDTALLVDPFDNLAFKTALTFDVPEATVVTVTQTPTVVFVDGALPVPEPSTYLMMLVGLGSVGMLARRRQQVKA